MLQPSAVQNKPISAIIGLGANLPSKLGAPSKTLRYALDALDGDGIGIQSVSRFYATPCFPQGAGPDYVNAVAMLRTDLNAPALLSRIHRVEAAMGRERTTRWGQRTLDLDLLAYGDEICPDLETFQRWQDLPQKQQSKTAPDQLILPHPRLQDRAFVLVPLAEIAPDWRHPVLGRTARELLNDLDAMDIAQVVPL